MTPLRVTAILSNILFSLFGLWAHIYPVMLLHLILLPVNIARLVQIRHVVRGISQNADLSMQSILPLMVRRRFHAGETLMRKGEQADRLFYLVDGQVEVIEIRKTLSSGTVIGEIGVFARHQQRIATVVSDCELYELSASKAKELYYQDPSFGYAVLQTIIARLIENMAPANPMAANSHASDKAL
jgi:CRP-like cAMP-binding protein